MRINKVTLTGADDKTDIKLLQEIQKEYSFVEWGILISTKQNENRYPSEDFIYELRNKGLNLALHVCGKHSRGIMQEGNVDPIIKYDWFNRYQINFNFEHTQHDIWNYINMVKKFTNKNFILQDNSSNKKYINTILSTLDGLSARTQYHIRNNNTDVLYDSSGGRGTEIKSIQEPYLDVYTGYSGGLNPENVESICEKLTNFSNDATVWIDMESGVRTDDIFDLEKVVKVLDIVKNFI